MCLSQKLCEAAFSIIQARENAKTSQERPSDLFFIVNAING